MSLSDSTARKQRLNEEYVQALRDYLATAQPASLERLDRLTRSFLDEGICTPVEVASLHHRAVVASLVEATSGSDAAAAAGTFARFCATCPTWSQARGNCSCVPQEIEVAFTEALAPFAESSCEVHKSNRALLRLNEVREQETRRIAQLLHSEASQLMVAVHLALNQLAEDVGEREKDQIDRCRQLLNRVEEELRQISHELRPRVLDDLGLKPALEFLASGVEKRTGIRVTVLVPEADRLKLSAETVVYRVAQEALANAAKHSGASQILVELAITANAVECRIQDDGHGFSTASVNRCGLGLIGMQERVESLHGRLSISSRPGHGTRVVASIPREFAALPAKAGAKQSDGEWPRTAPASRRVRVRANSMRRR